MRISHGYGLVTVIIILLAVIVSLFASTAVPVTVPSDLTPLSGNNTKLTNETSSTLPVVYFFYNPTCGSCQRVLPFVDEYTKNNPDVLVKYYDIGASQENRDVFNQFQQGTESTHIPVIYVGSLKLEGVDNITENLDQAVRGSLSTGTANDLFYDIHTVNFFYNPQCESCQKTLPFITEFAAKNPNVPVHLYNIAENQSNLEKLNGLMRTVGVEHSHLPIVFIGTTMIEGEENITGKLESTLIQVSSGQVSQVNPQGLSSNSGQSTVNPLVLLIAAITEGLNPCGLLVLALLLVSLMASGSRRTVLFIGIAYIIAFFIVRLLSGFAIFSIIQIPGIARIFTLVAAFIAIVAGLIQIRDGLAKSQTPLLSIPSSKKGLISSYMKKASIPAGFIVGGLVGIYGMACTAGIYISILGMLYNDVVSGLYYLVLYNFIVIIPLIAILLLVFFGLPPERVNAWREEKKSILRLAIGIVMLIMGIIILIPIF